MKALLLRLGALSLACAPLAVPSPASAQAGYDSVREIAEFCKELTENPTIEWTRGTCLASLIVDASALDNFVCWSWEREGLLEYYGFRNMGECVKSGIAAP